MSDFDKIRKILFLPEEQVYIGGQYGTQPCSQYKRGEFFCINSLNGPRSDQNIANYRNFLFEIDTLSLEEQLEILEKLKPFLASIVYSGGKSYHAIVSLETALPRLDLNIKTRYTIIWEQLSKAFSKIVSKKVNFDPACKNPSRLTRFPGWLRNTGKIQTLVYTGNYLTNEQFASLCPPATTIVTKKYQNDSFILKSYSDLKELKSSMPIELQNRLMFPKKWAAPAGLYPILLKNCLWMIDATGVSKELMVEFLEHYTFPTLIKAGYPSEKLMRPIEAAYSIKLAKSNLDVIEQKGG